MGSQTLGGATQALPGKTGQGAGGGGGGKSMPPAPDYKGYAREQSDIDRQLVNEQTLQNRPNQQTPFASTIWDIGPDGRPIQRVGLNGPLAGAADNVSLQVAEQYRQPLDYSGLTALGTGDAAREQAINAAYGQATSRLDPRFSRQREALRTQLLNQGLSEGSQAYNRAMSELGTQETDAYNQAIFSAQREGTAAGQALFNQNLAARQQGIGELLQRRNQPMQELQALQGLTAMPGYAQAGRAGAPDLVGAAGLRYGTDLQRYQMNQQQFQDMLNTLLQLGVTGASFLSDERAKVDIRRSTYEVLPGVPLATWSWRPEFDDSGPTAGVVAQDLQRVAPDLVHEGPDGYLMVDYGALGAYL